MSSKVTFGDVLINDDMKNDGIPVDDGKKTKKEIRPANLIPVVDRLRDLLRRGDSFGRHDPFEDDSDDDDNQNSDDDDNDDDDDNNDVDVDDLEDEIMDGEETEDDQQLNSREETSNEYVIEIADDERSVDGAATDSEDEKGPSLSTSSFYDHFFLSSSTESDTTIPWKSLKPIDNNLHVFGRISFQEQNLPQINHYRDIPNLNKLWKSKSSEKFSILTSGLLSYQSSYADSIVEGRSHENDQDLLDAMLTHICVHVMKARTVVKKHNQRIKSKLDAAKIAAANSKKKSKSRGLVNTLDDEVDEESAHQDQGFCRPRVLILCPFRSTAFQCVSAIQSILGPNTSIGNYDKFVAEYGPDEEDEGSRAASRRQNKPPDWQHLFSLQNNDDDFKLGIQINPMQGRGHGSEKGAHLRLFSDFYISDVIIASPLGLRLVMEKDEKNLNYDFLSSLEIIGLHQADVMYMQNWEHVEFVMAHCNKLLKESREGTDYSRVRPYFLDEKSHLHRQLIVNTAFMEPILQTFFRSHATSCHGSVRIKKDWGEGSIVQVIPDIPQVFHRIQCDAPDEQDDRKFQYFSENTLTSLLRQDQGATLILTPSYFDYIRVRNELMRQEADAVFVCEYSQDSDITRGRSKFFHGQVKIMLYSGRSHFFRYLSATAVMIRLNDECV